MVTLVGNAATAVEHRQTTAGATVARFRLAATSRRWDKALERWTDGETSFYTVRSWRGLADNVAASVAVGEPLIVQGRLRLREGEQSPERGGQRWFSAEVDAVAIGHDLARGTAAFRRVARTARTGMDSTAPSSPQPSQPPAQSSGSAPAAQPQGSPQAEQTPGSPQAEQTPGSPQAEQTPGSPQAVQTPESSQLWQSPGPAQLPQQGSRDEALSAAGAAPVKALSRPASTASGRREDPVAPRAGGTRKVPVVPTTGGSRKVPVVPAAAERPAAVAERPPAAGTPARAGAPQTVESSTIPPVPPPVEPPDPSVAPTAAGADSPEKVAVS
ncbi:single-stranded DNA-binding protein [Streptomyces sp. ISID311]|uniref:single-stranded DNA-binding protein n=1 Tax=Streptomyces sp. ISID311 TaxID=2601673 RepID=UPI0021C43F67|nr:single-stranded DNA-binding protein [Streptomyces sp. ISID311]